MFEKLRATIAAKLWSVMLWCAARGADFTGNKRGDVDMMWIVGLVIGLTVAATLLPTAVVDITNTTLWEGAPASVIAIVPILGIGVVAALLYRVFKS